MNESGDKSGKCSSDSARSHLARRGEAAGFAFPIHAHMLRHSAGYALAVRGVDTRTLQAFMGATVDRQRGDLHSRCRQAGAQHLIEVIATWRPLATATPPGMPPSPAGACPRGRSFSVRLVGTTHILT